MLQHSFTADKSLLRRKEQTAREPDLQKYLQQVKSQGSFYNFWWFTVMSGNHITILDEHFKDFRNSWTVHLLLLHLSGSLEWHTQNANASAKHVLELQGSQPNRQWCSCTIEELLYFCVGETGKKYSAEKLARELKDHVYQQQVVDLWSETPGDKDLGVVTLGQL